jgi:hypothetical protein
MTQPISGSDIEQHVPLTDVVLMLYLEEIPQVSEGPSGEPIYEAEALRKASAGAFTMGCAIGMDFPDLVRPILEQTHSDEGADTIIEDCEGPLTEQVVEARAANQELNSALFLESLFEAMEEDEEIEAQAAYNVLSISFEYGCILAKVERRAALLVRNDFNRKQAEQVEAMERGEEPFPVLGPDPNRPIQDTAKELVTAYQADIGFSDVDGL